MAEDLGKTEDGVLEVLDFPKRLEERGDHPDGDRTVACKEAEVGVLTDELEDAEGVLLPQEESEEHLDVAGRRLVSGCDSSHEAMEV